MNHYPQYQCHKTVGAFQIGSVDRLKDAVLVRPKERGLAPARMTHAWADRHKPEPGGYFVVYQDGYSSYSPKEAFESGYAKKIPLPAANEDDVLRRQRYFDAGMDAPVHQFPDDVLTGEEAMQKLGWPGARADYYEVRGFLRRPQVPTFQPQS